MAKITTSITRENNSNSIGSLLNDANNVYNQALGSLPNIPPDSTDIVQPTDGTTNEVDDSTDVVAPPLPTNADARDYEVWASTWRNIVNSDAISVVPMAWTEKIGGWSGPATTDLTDDTISNSNYLNFKNTLLNIPEGRRVVYTGFWSTVSPSHNWSPLQHINYYASVDGTTINGKTLPWTAWQDNIISDAKVSFNEFLSRCASDSLSFDYILDHTHYGDGGCPNIWTISTPPVLDTYKIYVSLTGNDSGSGTSIETPVKTFKKAADLAKTYFANGGTLNVEILIRGGTYQILGTDSNPIFYLNSTYSAPEGKLLAFRPYRNEQVNIVGSETINHTEFTLVTSSDSIWSRISTEARGNVYVADVSDYDLGPGIPESWSGDGTGGAAGAVHDLPAIPDLVFNDSLMTVARWPNKTSQHSNGYTVAECAVISTVVDTGTNGSWCVDPAYLPSNYYANCNCSTDNTTECFCGNGQPDPSCFINGKFTYSSDYDSVVSKWTTNAINDGIWLHGFWRWDWNDEVYKVLDIDTDNRIITVRSKNSAYGIQNYTLCDQDTGALNCSSPETCGTYLANPSPRRWFALNILEELNSAGEYYIDRTNKKLYFWPPEALSSSSKIEFTHRAVAGAGAKDDNTFEYGYNQNGQVSRENYPYEGWVETGGWNQTGGGTQSRTVFNTKNALRSLFKFYKIKNVIIEGLTFKNCAGSGIELNLCQDITVRKCKVFNMKKHGIYAPGGKNVTIDSCTIHDVGHSGIINTGGNRQTLESANKIVTKCSIKRWGRQRYTYGVGVNLNGCGNTASYNLISDGSTAIISVGNNNLIEYNHLHNLISESDDAGGIYSGRNMGSFNIIIRNNFFNNVKSNLAGGYIYSGETSNCVSIEAQGTIGIYFDDLMCGHKIEKNVFYQCGSGFGGGVFFNGGVYHNVENNMFIECNTAYGSPKHSVKYWNYNLAKQTFLILNPDNYPWYEAGGPVGSDGQLLPTTGYSPYTYYGTGEGWSGWPSPSAAGMMPVVDITKPVYQEAAPYLSRLLRKNAQNNMELVTENLNEFINVADNNVIINCTTASRVWNGATDPRGDTNPVYVGGFRTINEYITDTEPEFENSASLNFQLTSNGLAEVQQNLPEFEDINFKNIPTIDYVPEQYQYIVNCAQGLRHYSCEKDFADPDILEAIITDSRYTTTVNTINGKTLSQDFMSRYNSIITKTNTMDRSLYTIYSNSWYVTPQATSYAALSPMFGYITSEDQPNRMTSFPWANSNTNAATRAWTGVMFDWGLFYRIDLLKQPLIDNGYSAVKYGIDYSYPITAEEVKFHQDQYGGWQQSVRDNATDSLVTPPLYGEMTTGMFNTYAYIANPQNDDQRYIYALVDQSRPLPDGYFRFASKTWLAFMTDLKLLRSIIRSNYSSWERMTPWLTSKDNIGDRFAYGRDNGVQADQYWKEIIFHACLHGTEHFNYFNSASSTTQNEEENTLELHEILDEWRTISGNSRARPVVTERIASNSNVIISGGKLLKSNRYLWRITAKPSASVTLKAYGTSTNRTDIPQTITLSNNNRGVWLTTSSSVAPIYILDEGAQQQETELVYISLMRSDLDTGDYKMKALFGGNTHDYGSGVGFDQNGKSRSALVYFTNSNIKISAHQVGNLDWYYTDSYRLDSQGKAIPVVINTTPTTQVSLCTSPCYSGDGCYQAPPLFYAEFVKEMSQTGEWGPALRPLNPFPNYDSSGTYYNYITVNGTVFTKQYDSSKPKDYAFYYYGNGSTAASGTTPTNDQYYSFWMRTPENGGRNDLAYNYDAQGTIQLKAGFDYPVPSYDTTKKIRSSADGVHVKMEPGNMWKYQGFTWAPIREDDGCADHLWIDRYNILLNRYKEYEEYKYFVNNLPEVPSCITQSDTWNDLTHEHYDENGKFKPEYVFVNYEDELVDQIRSLNPTGRTSRGNYGKIAGQELTDDLWIRVVSYIKLTRKMNHYMREVFGPQAKVNHYDMMPFPYYQEWASNWYPNKNGILWSTDPVETPGRCPFCDELDIGYPGDEVYNQLSSAERIAFMTKANEALQDKVFKFANAIAKMCLFVNNSGQDDVLDLRAELIPLFPQLNPDNFIITGLNHYSNSAHGALVNNTHKYYAMTMNGFNSADEVNYTNNAETNRSRQMSKHAKDQARVGLFDNQRSGKLYSFFTQGTCGCDSHPMFYEYYNCNLQSEAGYTKSWTNPYFVSSEVNQFPTTTNNANHAPGDRKYDYKYGYKNISRRSILRHMPWINITNDLLVRTQLQTTIKYKNEIIWGDNNIQSVIWCNLSKTGAAPQGFYDQKRPCAQNETPNDNCRDIVANPYIKPDVIEDNTKIRYNAAGTFICSTDPTNANFTETCNNYCYMDPIIPAGGQYWYNRSTLYGARRHIYGLAVEYASYDDMVAVPYEDIGNDIYWTGYYGQNARFDPFITTPPQTVAEARNLDSSEWPYIRLSETAKRAVALGYILAARKEYSLSKFIKNSDNTELKDWPQPAANFTVDRRPGIAITNSISGANYNLLQYTGDNTTNVALWKKCLDGSNNPIPNTGFQKIIENYLTWNYDRGIRRFLMWTPGGTLSVKNGGGMPGIPLDSYYPVYTSAITSSMQNKIYDQYKLNADGSTTVIARYVNPSEACWRNITTPVSPVAGDSGTLLIPASVEEAESYPLCSSSDWDGESPCFDPDGRKNEVLTCLSEWIQNHPEADVGIYMGYTIPLLNGQPESGINTIIGSAGSGNFLQNATSGRGWAVPDPENNTSHAQFLTEELQPFVDVGIKFVSLDVGLGMFNYQNGGTFTYGDTAASKEPVGDYKSWLTQQFGFTTVIAETMPVDFRAPILNEFNQTISNTSHPRKTILKTDVTKEVCKGTLVPSTGTEVENPFNSVYTDTCWHNKGRERYRKLDPVGKNYTPENNDENDLVYSGGAYQYCPYIITLNGYLNSGEWNIGMHNDINNIGNFAGIDPNNMLCWYRKNTEINLFVENFELQSEHLRKKYRQYFPNSKDSSGNFVYNNLWQLIPAWHDQGLATATPALSGIPDWDGRKIVRDTDFYNKIRNELFVKLKNYIERGYVYWTTISKEDFQLRKDVHADVLNYISGYEIEDDIYPEDEITSALQVNLTQKNYNVNNSATYNSKQSIMQENILDNYTTTDEG